MAIESMPGDRHFETAVEDNTLVAFWTGQPTAERLEVMVEQLQRVWRQHQTGVFLLNVITADTGIPDAETRRVILGLLAVAIVLEKSGIDATMSRAILSTLVTISRRPFAMKVFSERAAAAAWLNKQGGAGASAMIGVIRQLEGRLSTRMRLATAGD